MALDVGRELLILGILRGGALGAYDVARAVNRHGPMYRDLARGNVYAQLEQLHGAGMLLERSVAAKRGPRAVKTLYHLSAAGKRRFDALLAAVMADVQAPDGTLEVACVLLGQLTREGARALLGSRLAAVRAQEKRLGRLFGNADERSGSGEIALLHTIARLRGEIGWLRETMVLLQDAKWRPDWR